MILSLPSRDKKDKGRGNGVICLFQRHRKMIGMSTTQQGIVIPELMWVLVALGHRS